MALDLGILSARVALDDKEYQQGLGRLESKSESSFKNIAKMGFAYLSFRGMFAFGSQAIKVFSDLEEETNKFNVVFQEMGANAKKVLQELRKDFGLSELSAKKMLAGSGDIFTGIGFSRDISLDLSEAIAKRGADLASYTNYVGGAIGASEALTKMALGEAESVKALGIVIQQNSEEYKNYMQQAQTTGVYIEALGKTFKASSTIQAKAIASIAIAYDQTKNAQGDFLRSQDSIANKTKTLKNNLEELYTKIGSDSSGVYSDALSGVNSLIKGYNNLEDSTRELLNTTILTTASLTALSKVGVISSANTALSGVTSVFKGGSTAQIKAEQALVAESEKVKTLTVEQETAKRIEAENKKRMIVANNAQAEAQAVQAVEQQKLIAVQKRVEAETVLNKKAKAQYTLINGTSKGFSDTTALVNAKNELAVAEKALTVATKKNTLATKEQATVRANLVRSLKANTASAEALTKTTTAQAIAQANVNKLSTVGGRSLSVLSAGATKAKGAFTALNTALGPVGWTMIALGALYTTYNYMVEKNRKALSSQTSAMKDNTEAMLAQAQANAKQREQAVQSLTKLEELSGYEVLHQDTKAEALKMIEELTKKYGDLGIKIDENTGKLKIEADAWAKLSEKQAQEVAKDNLKNLNANTAETTALENNLRNEARSMLKDNIFRQGVTEFAIWAGVPPDGVSDKEVRDKVLSTDNQLEIDRIQQLNDIDEKIKAYEDLKNTFYNESDEKNAQRVKEIIANLEKAKEYKKLNDEYRDNKKNKVKTPTLNPADQPLNNQNELNQYRTAMWNIQFNDAEAVQKAQMLASKISTTFQAQSGKYGNLNKFMSSDTSKMSADELKDLQKIVELEHQRRDIIKDYYEEKRQAQEQAIIEANDRMAEQQRSMGAWSVKELEATMGGTTVYEKNIADNTKDMLTTLQMIYNNGGLTY